MSKILDKIEQLEKESRKAGGAKRIEFLVQIAGVYKEMLLDLVHDEDEVLFILSTAATFVYSKKYNLDEMAEERFGSRDDEDEDEDEDIDFSATRLIKVDADIDEDELPEIIKKIVSAVKEIDEEEGNGKQRSSSKSTYSKKKSRNTRYED